MFRWYVPLNGTETVPVLTVCKARALVSRSDGLEQTRALAQEYADKAVHAISAFPDSEAKDGLIEMCVKTMQRRK